jgi:hypothetical protein
VHGVGALVDVAERGAIALPDLIAKRIGRSPVPNGEGPTGGPDEGNDTANVPWRATLVGRGFIGCTGNRVHIQHRCFSPAVVHGRFTPW